MNKKLFTGLLSITAALTLAACGPQTDTNEEVEQNFPEVITHEEKAIEGGTLKVAVLSASPLQGLLNPILYTDNTDSSMIDYAFESIFHFGEDLNMDDKGMATHELDRENKIFTIKFKDGLKWSDGEPLTVDDYIYTYEVIGRPDYKGVRYGEDAENIIGMTAFHNGEADSIEGLEKVDDQTLKIHLTDVYPALEAGGGAINSSIIPKHVYEGMTYDEMIASDKTRENIVGNGAFMVEKVIPGETVTYVRNPYYWKGVAKLDGVIASIVSPEQIVAEMKAGSFDIASNMPAAQYETFKDLSNIEFVGMLMNDYSYIGFNLGHYDSETKTHVMDADKKMANKNLRQAMGYAINNAEVAKEVLHGLSIPANSAIPPFFKEVYLNKEELPGYSYDPEKAKQLLADAGYVDVTGDGIVEDPKGEELTITLLTATGSDASEAIIQDYIQKWNEVGLNVVYFGGRSIDFNTVSDKLQSFAQDFDIFTGGWGVGYNPDPSGLYGPSAMFNFTHINTPEQTAIFERIGSNETFDKKVKKDLFAQWQKYANEEAFIIPRFNNYALTAVNKRVKNYSIKLGEETDLNTIELTADEPLAAN